MAQALGSRVTSQEDGAPAQVTGKEVQVGRRRAKREVRCRKPFQSVAGSAQLYAAQADGDPYPRMNENTDLNPQGHYSTQSAFFPRRPRCSEH